MIINILTLFPDFFETPLNCSILKRAQKKQLVNFKLVDIRNFATDKHRLTDDRPYGGGPGMVMKVEPIDLALRFLKVKKGQSNQLIVLTSAKGEIFTQQKAKDWSKLQQLTVICGHYEGVDQRVAEYLVDQEVRIGDYVLTGGEPASLVIADAVTRLVPGVLGNEASPIGESHQEPGEMSHPQYTRPEEYKGWKVPDILVSGNHQKIKAWRKQRRQQG